MELNDIKKAIDTCIDYLSNIKIEQLSGKNDIVTFSNIRNFDRAYDCLMNAKKFLDDIETKI